MNLLTPKLLKMFEGHELYSQDGKGMNALVVAKFFLTGSSYTFFATEGEMRDDDFIMFGFVISPLGYDCDELGYSSLKEMSSVRNRLGLGVERDLSFPVFEVTLKDAIGKARVE
jgi:hypothetical protein